MHDLRFIRNNPETVRQKLAKKGAEGLLDRLLAADERWRSQLATVEELKAERNRASEEIGRLKRAGEDAGEAVERMQQVAGEIRRLDGLVKEAEAEIQEILLNLPNLPHDSVPEGPDETGNVEVRRWGEPRNFDFEPKPHWEIGAELGIIDPEAGGKVTGSRFVFLKGAGARLQRALISFMLDVHTQEHGYQEIWPPFLVNRASMTGTGQLPKFEEDAFKLSGDDYFLIPTAEVPVTNLHREEVLPGARLPLRYAAFSSCFRREAGSHGRDTRGLIRLHQFEKVELVWFCRPEESYQCLEELLGHAEAILQRLELPYRVLDTCTGDLGFSQAKTYDPEVWMPSYGRYVEISSCSNFESFQARRAGIRFRPEPGAKAEYVHTLNGSGLAVGRTVAAILENHQRADGSVAIPKALRPYMGGQESIEPEPEKS